jgi:hypothetical protein
MNYAMVRVLPVRNYLYLLISLYAGSSFALAAPEIKNPFQHPLYAGAAVGYGATTWQGLVPAKENQNVAINISAPTFAKEGGAVWGVFTGYEFNPFFAMEASYMHYPDATLYFDENSLFAFDHGDNVTLTTRTESLAIMAKIMMIIPKSRIRAYSSAGFAEIHRKDNINEQWRPTPTFGVGFNYNLNEHVMAEIASTYTAGYGESEINPVNDYVPFLYAVFFKLAYRI